MHRGAWCAWHGRRWRWRASEQDLGIFSDHKVDMSQPCETALAKLISLHHTNRTISRSREAVAPRRRQRCKRALSQREREINKNGKDVGVMLYVLHTYFLKDVKPRGEA